MFQIELPAEFDASHERAVVDYLSDRLSGREAWAHAFAAFDILDHAVLVTEEGAATFRQLYQQVVDQGLADTYINRHYHGSSTRLTKPFGVFMSLLSQCLTV